MTGAEERVETTGEDKACIDTGRASLFDRIEHHWIEVLAAALLALATLMSAWSAYQSAKWNARSTEYYNASDVAMFTSSEYLDKAFQEGVLDTVVFTNFENALAQGLDWLAAEYRARGFSSQLEAAYQAWEQLDPENNPATPRNPFNMKEYQSEFRKQSNRYRDLARSEASKAKQADKDSNDFILLTVMFAAVLFFAGISTKFMDKRIKVAVLAMGVVMFVVSVIVFALQPYS